MSAPIPAPISIGALDLAALLCSRVCHDLISPVGAIVNGLEVMEEDKDEETKTFALELIKKSASQASAKLQFCRLAFGAAGSAGAQIELGDAEKAARGFLEDGKTTLMWKLPRELVPKNRAKLLLNMLMVAGGTIPRGGTLTAEAADAGYRVTATGSNARLAPATTALLAGSPAQTVDAHAIQPFYTGILARDCGLVLSATLDGDVVAIVAC
ncbi:MAG TPA: histidine phosphotransferase family protein [Xanthobacteraceae bacterium]|nr:histidine phosphotransferase family protein [Xanthobacteraceae bacterium]